MKDVKRSGTLSFVLFLALVTAVALFSAQCSAHSSAGGIIVGKRVNMPVGADVTVVHVRGHVRLTNTIARRMGAHRARVSWALEGQTPQRLYLFNVTALGPPSTSFWNGGPYKEWRHFVFFDGGLRRLDVNVDAATKPQHNYYLLCAANPGPPLGNLQLVICSPAFSENTNP